MPSRIDEAGHTKGLDYPVAEHWGEPKCSVPRVPNWGDSREQVEQTLILNVKETHAKVPRSSCLVR